MQPRTKGQEIAERIKAFTNEQPNQFVMRGYTYFDHTALGDFNLSREDLWGSLKNKWLIPTIRDLIEDVHRFYDPHYDKGPDFVPVYPGIRESPDEYHDLSEIIVELAEIIKFMESLAEESDEDLEAASEILE